MIIYLKSILYDTIKIPYGTKGWYVPAIHTHSLYEHGETLVCRVYECRLVDGRLRVTLLDHLQVLRRSFDMLPLMQNNARVSTRERQTAAILSISQFS